MNYRMHKKEERTNFTTSTNFTKVFPPTSFFFSSTVELLPVNPKRWSVPWQYIRNVEQILMCVYFFFGQWKMNKTKHAIHYTASPSTYPGKYTFLISFMMTTIKWFLAFLQQMKSFQHEAVMASVLVSLGSEFDPHWVPRTCGPS